MKKTKSKNRLIDTFFLALQIEGRSPKTISRYGYMLSPFFEFIKKDPLEVQPTDIRSYLGHLDGLGYAKTTVWTARKDLHSFYEYCRREGYLSQNPVSVVPKPKIPKVFPKILSEAEIISLLQSAKRTGNKFIRKRNYAVLCLLYDSGLRASELCGLKLSDVSLSNQMVKVYGKHSKERIVPFSPDTAKHLRSYLKTRGEQSFEDSFFITKRGDKITRHRLLKIMKQLANVAGIDPSKVNVHVMRHSFATSWIRNGGDAKKLQMLLGHSDSRIVDVYLHLMPIDLKRSHNQFSPLQKLKNER